MPYGRPPVYLTRVHCLQAGLAAAALFLCPHATAQSSPGEAEVLRLEVHASTAQAEAQVTGWGTAFVVAPGFLVTNAHVAGGTVRIRDSVSGQRYAARVVALDTENDLALLESQAPGSPLPLAAGPASVRMRVFTMGYPDPTLYGLNRKYTAGWVRTPASADGVEPMTLYLSAFPGNSGSPVCNDKGQVIGVIKGGLTKPLIQGGVQGRSEPMPVATPVAALLALLAENGIKPASYGLGGALEKVADALAPSVYLVERSDR
jgi:S1-C subfamily serine protease